MSLLMTVNLQDSKLQFSPPIISQESNHHCSEEKKKRRTPWVILKARTQSSWVFTHNKWNSIRIYGERKKNCPRLLRLFSDEELHISGYYHLYMGLDRALMDAVHVHGTAHLPTVPLRHSKGFQPSTIWTLDWKIYHLWNQKKKKNTRPLESLLYSLENTKPQKSAPWLSIQLFKKVGHSLKYNQGSKVKINPADSCYFCALSSRPAKVTYVSLGAWQLKCKSNCGHNEKASTQVWRQAVICKTSKYFTIVNLPKKQTHIYCHVVWLGGCPLFFVFSGWKDTFMDNKSHCVPP